MSESKSVLQSKTLWINFLMGVAAFFPSVNAWISSHPEAFTTLFTIVNMLLRFITKSQIEIK